MSGQLIKKLVSKSNTFQRKILLLQNGQLASAGKQIISIWNLKLNMESRILKGHTSFVWTLLSINKSTLASGSDDLSIKLWNIIDGLEMKTLRGHFDSLRALVLLSNGYLVSASLDMTIRIWDLENGALVETSLGLEYIGSLCSLTDGNLASGDSSGAVKIFYFKKSLTSNLSSNFGILK
jgi:WD40 repeat protein